MERILDAAEGVISERGFDAATISDIVRRAQSSVGVFYARFRDKEALLNLLHERFHEEAVATTDAALDPAEWEGSSIAEIVTELIPFLVRIYRERQGLIRAFILRGVHDTAFAESAGRLCEHITERLRGLMLARIEEIGHWQPPLAVDFGIRMVFAMLDQCTLMPSVQSLAADMTDEQLAAELVRGYLSYLGIDADRGET
ncbi:MAG: TetR/AcrR family transcriptional regulator [Pirellulales bacterium]|nr:TetR/AcrR family transcriptional regulator [Pirellulales bacterium]